MIDQIILGGLVIVFMILIICIHETSLSKPAYWVCPSVPIPVIVNGVRP